MVKPNARTAPPTTGERMAKKPRLEDSKTTKFTSIPAIQAALNVNNKKPSTVLIQSLTNLRNQISLRYSEIQSHLEDPRTKLVAPNDERLLLVEEWCKASPGLPELFAIWNESLDDSAALANGSQAVAMANSTVSLVLSTLTNIFLLLSTSYAFQSHGVLVVKNFTPDHWRKLNTYIAGGQGKGRNVQGGNNELTLVALRLVTVISEKWDPKRVFESFVWESKALPKLFTLRRKTDSSPLVKPDIRTAFIFFLVSFLSSGADNRVNSQTKIAFLSTSHSLSTFLSLFKTLHTDHVDVIKRVLEVCWEGVWCDIRVSRSLKIGAFGDLHGVLGNLLKLYDNAEAGDADYSPADLVHHFLLAICTRPGVGLCFEDRGWYPREGDEDSVEEGKAREFEKGKLYNIILSQFLKTLKVTDDPRQQELALKILKACPELVSGYLPASGLTLDPPRLSSKWLANIAFVSGVISLPVPAESFYLAATNNGEALYNPVPPPVGTILGNVLPNSQNMNLKNVFTKGLQFATSSTADAKIPASRTQAGNLVQHTTALALIKCLEKLASVKKAFEEVALALGEGGEMEGQWTRRLKEVMREVRRRLPEFQVVIAFCGAHLRAFNSHPQAPSDVPAEGAVGSTSSSASLIKKRALLAECAMRLLWMYQKCLPEIVEGARFDVGKILVGFEFAFPVPEASNAGSEADDDRGGIEREEEDDNMEESEGGSGSDGEEGEQEEEGEGQAEEDQEPEDVNAARRLHRVTQLHILRFLKESDAFVGSGGWTGKVTGPNGQSQTHLYTLLTQFIHFHPSSASGSYESSIRTQLASLVKHILASTLLFQQDPDEADLWLNALPFGARRFKVISRAKNAQDLQEGEEDEMVNVTVYPETPDGTSLTDERDAVASFLDECVQRGMKAPYKYIEEMSLLASSSGHSDAMDVDSAPQSSTETPEDVSSFSPVLYTVVEQVIAKVRAKLLSPSDFLAVVTFIRKVFLGLLGKVELSTLSCSASDMLGKNPSLAVLVALATKLEEGLETKKIIFADDGEHLIIKRTVWREIKFVLQALTGQSPFDATSRKSSKEDEEDIDDFLDLVDGLDLPPSKKERLLTAFELVDWVRLLDSDLNAEQAFKIFTIVKEIGGPWALRELSGFVLFGQGASLWEALKFAEDQSPLEGVPFEYLLRSASAERLVEPRCQSIIVAAAISQRPMSFLHPTSRPETVSVYYSRVVRLLLHDLLIWKRGGNDEVAKALFVILGRLLESIKTEPLFPTVKELVFNGLPALKEIMLSDSAVRFAQAGITLIQAACLDYTSPKDREVVSHISNSWRDRFLSWLDDSATAPAPAQLDYSLTWIKFLDPLVLLDCLQSGLASTTTNKQYLVRLLQVAAKPLRFLAASPGSRDRQESTDLLNSRLDLLFELQALLSSLPGEFTDAELSGTLEELVASALEAGLPMGLSGYIPDPPSSFSHLIRTAEARWTRSHSRQDVPSAPRSTPSLLAGTLFTAATGRIVSNLFYSTSGSGPFLSEESLPKWFDVNLYQTGGWTSTIPTLYSILDSTLHRSCAPSALTTFIGDDKQLKKLLQHLFEVLTTEGAEVYLRYQVLGIFTSLIRIVKKAEDAEATSGLLASFARLNKRLGNDPPYISREWIALAQWVHLNCGQIEGTQSFVNDVLETGLQYAIRQLPNEHTASASTYSPISEFSAKLTALIELPQNIQCNPSTVDTLLSVVIENHLHHPSLLKLAKATLGASHLKPLIVNRHLQSIVQHPRFYKVFNLTPSPVHSARDDIASLLHTMFHLHPSNTCQISHVEPLLQVYRGTLSKADQRIFAIFYLFERQRKLSVAALLSKWSNPLTASPVQSTSLTSLEALQTLEPTTVLRTALAFPYWRNLDDVGTLIDTQAQEEQGYDPVFVFLLLGHVLSENPPSGNIGWIEFFRTNVVGMLVRALSSRFGPMRKLALSLLAGVWKCVQNAELHEKEHLLYILNQIKNLIPPPSTLQGMSPPQLPSYITLLLFHSLRGIFNPAHFMYPLTSRFLLQRPELDVTDVPMLYSLLYSSSDDRWRKERGWILRFLADGMLATGSGTQDWKILKRRHTWDLLASMYQSTQSDSNGDKDAGLRQAILSVLVNLTRHQRPCSGLVLKSGLLSWMEMQLRLEMKHQGKNDALAWIKIIENLILVLDVGKLEGSALEGEWQATLWRCIRLLLTKHASAVHVLPFATRAMLRLVGYSKPGCSAFAEAISLALQRLEDMEMTMQPPDASQFNTVRLSLDDTIPLPLHGSYTLHEKPALQDTFVVWGRLVEILWRVVMRSPDGESALSSVWSKLTSRLLVWRAYVGAENSPEGEWARVQVVKNVS